MTPNASTLTSPQPRDVAFAVLALAQTVLFLVPIMVLGQAIGWPASLRLPAGEMMPLIAANPFAVQFGYAAYLLTSLALIPFALALRRHAIRRGIDGLLVDAAVALGVVAGAMKMLGIVRWHSAMPALAAMNANAADPASRQAIEAIYFGINSYAGAVGELLGVQLVGGAFIVAAGLVLARGGMRRIGYAGVLVGVLFVACAGRIFWPGLAAIQSIAAPLGLVWFVALSAVVWRGR